MSAERGKAYSFALVQNSNTLNNMISQFNGDEGLYFTVPTIVAISNGKPVGMLSLDKNSVISIEVNPKH